MSNTENKFQVVEVTLVETIPTFKTIYVQVPVDVDVNSLNLSELYFESEEMKSFQMMDEDPSEGNHFINNVRKNLVLEDEIDFIYQDNKFQRSK